MAVFAMPFATFASYDGDDSNVIDGVTVQVRQQNTSYAGYSNVSPNITAPITNGIVNYPQSLCSLNSAVSVLSGDTISPEIQVDIAYPSLGKPSVVYLAVVNSYGVFNSNVQIDTYFSWNDSSNAYLPKTGFGGSLGYGLPSSYMSYSVPSKSSRTFTCKIRQGGSQYTTSSWEFSPTLIDQGTALFPTPQLATGGGNGYNGFYWINGSNNVSILRMEITRDSDASNWPWTTLEVTIPKASTNKAVINSSNTSHYLHSAVFIPLCIAYDSSNWDSDVISAIDGVVAQLVTLGSSIHTDMTSIINALGSGNITVISGISNMLTQLQQINSKLSSVTGNRYSSAIQYIEYYLSQVLDNTDTMVEQLNDITSTLSSIANTIQSTNEQAEELSGSSEEVHAQEQVLFEQANSSIGSTVIGSFAFDPDTSAGMGRVGIDFTNLWNSLGNWHNVYIFSMILTLAFTIIRFSSARSRSKEMAAERADRYATRKAQRDFYNRH